MSGGGSDCALWSWIIIRKMGSGGVLMFLVKARFGAIKSIRYPMAISCTVNMYFYIMALE